MTHRYIGLLFSLALVSCANQQPPTTTKTTAKTQTKTAQIQQPKMLQGSCETAYTIKTGESAAERDSRIWSINSMTNTEADLIVESLYPQIAATANRPARPISVVQKDIEQRCNLYASEVIEYQSWIGATTACLYPKCVNAATNKLSAKMK